MRPSPNSNTLTVSVTSNQKHNHKLESVLLAHRVNFIKETYGYLENVSYGIFGQS